MEDSALKRAVEHIQRYQKIGVFIPSHATGDVIASASALASALSVLDKSVTLVCPDTTLNVEPQLPFVDEIAPLRINTSHLVVQLDTTSTALAELSYETIPGKVRIFLRPKEGSFSPQDVTVQAAEFPFDLVVLCGVQRPEQLGELFADNVELFYSLPRINIDVDPANETYGTINIVSVTTSSVSELVFRVLVAIDEVVAIPPAATALLTGIFHATDRLRTERTTPDTFAVVADLVAAGANYRTVAEAVLVAPRFSSMQLYGRILARLHESHEGRALYAFVQEHDLEKTGEQEVDTLAIATRIIREMPRTEVIVLGVPTGGGARVEVVSVHELQVKQLEGGFSVGGWNIRLVQGLWHATMVRSGNEQSSAIESLLKVGADRLAG